MTNEGKGCFSDKLLVSFWTVCNMAFKGRGLGNSPYFNEEWVPSEWEPNTFYEAGWSWDTEVIRVVVVFYYFARQYYSKHGWN